jgi:CRISPR-associated endoribonuclease Cas6
LEKAKYDKKNSYFQFPRDISFYISSSVDWILEQIAKNFVTGEEFYLNQNRLFLKSIAILQNINFNNEVQIKTINPIAMRSTDDKGKYKLCKPDEKFSELINKNLQKKWFVFKGKNCLFNLKIVPIAVKKSVVWYGNRDKGCVVEGWKGIFYLKGEPEFLKFAYDTGLGERNSMGFGMWEMVKKEVL